MRNHLPSNADILWSLIRESKDDDVAIESARLLTTSASSPGDLMQLAEVFTNHRVFSDRYSLRSIDEDAARRLFAPRFIEFWEALPPEDSWAAASCAGSLVVYRQAPWSAGREQEIDPADSEAFLHGAERIALAFHDASTETPPG